MVILLSPAKTMDMSPAGKCLATKPRMLDQAAELLLECKKLGKPGIKKVLLENVARNHAAPDIPRAWDPKRRGRNRDHTTSVHTSPSKTPPWQLRFED